MGVETGCFGDQKSFAGTRGYNKRSYPICHMLYNAKQQRDNGGKGEEDDRIFCSGHICTFDMVYSQLQWCYRLYIFLMTYGK